jgi:hypothetical protein
MKKTVGKGGRLQFRADVRVDFAIQANFFKSWRCPLHVHFTSGFEMADWKRSAKRWMILSRMELQSNIESSQTPRRCGRQFLTTPNRLIPQAFALDCKFLHTQISSKERFPHLEPPRPLPNVRRDV